MSARREYAGGFINEHRNLDAAMINKAHEAGLRWTVVKVHSGEGAPDVGHIPVAKLDLLRQKFGPDMVGGWGNFESHNDPILCAWAVNGIVSALGLKFYVANIEAPFADRVFLKELRRLQPSLVIWLSCLIEDPRDWEAWFKIGAIKPRSRIAQAWLPQCYMNLDTNWTPEQAVWWAQRKDVPPAWLHYCPPEYVKPTFSCINGKVDIERDLNTLDNTNARAMGLGPGFSVYLVENMQDWHWVDVYQGIGGRAAL